MAAVDMTAEEFKTVESMRQRLYNLTSSLESLRKDISQSQTLPTPASLQASALILQQNLSSLQRVLSDNSDLFTRMAVHPSTNYPGRTQEHVLGSLLRKKLEPDVEGLVEAARQAAISAGVDVSKVGKKQRRQDEDGEEEDEDEDGYQPEDDDGGDDPLANLWADVRVATTEKLKEFVSKEARHLFTAAEREMGVENVRTGLRRNLAEMEYEDDDEEEEEEEEGDQADKEDEDVDMDQGGVPVPVPGQTQPVLRETTDEELLWFMTRGETELPKGIETEATRNAANKAKRGGFGGR